MINQVILSQGVVSYILRTFSFLLFVFVFKFSMLDIWLKFKYNCHWSQPRWPTGSRETMLRVNSMFIISILTPTTLTSVVAIKIVSADLAYFFFNEKCYLTTILNAPNKCIWNVRQNIVLNIRLRNWFHKFTCYYDSFFYFLVIDHFTILWKTKVRTFTMKFAINHM